jgi:signal transduction histidine kinase
MQFTDREHALVEAGIALASELELDAILHKLLETAATLTGARFAALGVIGDDGVTLDRFVTLGLSEAERIAIGAPPEGRGVLGVVIREARPIRLSDLMRDPAAVGFPPNHPPMRSFLGVPILLRGSVYGNLYLTEKDGGEDFTDEDQDFTTLLAAQAAVAIENARRVERDALARAVQAQETERRRLARELHDGTGQALTSILLGLSSVERSSTLDEARAAATGLRELVVSTLQDVRRLSVELRPKALDDFGLGPALERLGQSVRETSGVDVQVGAHLSGTRLPPDVETAVYRIAQEALANVLRHAAAAHASIVVTRREGSASIVIEDDGRGFDVSAPVEGMGLAAMRERVRLLDGTMAVESRRGRGTTILVELPIRVAKG